MKRKNRTFPIKKNVAAVLLLAVLVVAILFIKKFECKSSKNLAVNYLKRGAAEVGMVISKFLPNYNKSNDFDFGYSQEPGIFITEKILSRLLESNYKVSDLLVSNFSVKSLRAKFDFENLENPELKNLKNKYALERFINNSKNELELILLLRGWINSTINKGEPSNVDYNFNTLDILSRASKGERFFCSEFATALTQCALSLGLQARYLGLFKGHVVTEIWSNQFNKWIVMDAYNNLHFDKEGIPLNAIELHFALKEDKIEGIRALIGQKKDSLSREKTNDLISYYKDFYVRMRNDWFSNKYPHWHPKANSIMNAIEWQSPITNNNILVASETSEIGDINFPLNQTSIKLQEFNLKDMKLYLIFNTFTPSFKNFVVKINDAQEITPESRYFSWKLKEGINKIYVYSVNSLGQKGPISSIQFNLNQKG